MTAADVFIDTNILVYAHDLDAGAKHAKAAALVRGFWEQRESPVVSVQVLQEMHVNLVRLGATVDESVDTTTHYLSWRVMENTRALLRKGWEAQQRWQLSFWDALIVAAAMQAGVSTLWSEDLNADQDFDGVTVVNPLV